MSGRKMLCLLVLLCVALVNSQAGKETPQDDEKQITQEEKIQCVKQLVEWCNKMQYPEEGGTGVALMSISYADDTDFYRVFCSSDSEGTNCSRNASPWFSCTPDHVFTYKGEVMTDATTEVDDDICKTQDKAFNQLSLYNMSYDNSTLSVIEKELKSLFREILAVREQMLDLQKRLGDGFSMGGDFWKGFGGFPFEHDEEDVEIVEKNEKKDSNQIERQ